MAKKNLIHLLVEESKSYIGIDKIVSLIEDGSELNNIPMHPLYMSIRSLPIEQKGLLLPRLSKEQRQALLDIDLWNKDYVNVTDFSTWLYVYATANDELKYEFVKSPEFALFLKARFNIWTFDAEDPQYPDHDYYFLSECNQLLFEYDENCEMVDQLKDAIKILYTEEGVEKAYAYLFKIVADQIGMMTEDEYRLKKNRLQDYGFIDYYEALELTNTFPTIKHLNNFLKKSLSTDRPKAHVDDEHKNQRVSYGALSPFEDQVDELSGELEKVENIERADFLSFNFVKLINANIEINGGIKQTAIELSKNSKETKKLIELGLNYTKQFIRNEYSENFILFNTFSFSELFKIGKSLIVFGQNEIKNTYRKNKLEETFDSFLGPFFEQFIAKSLSKEYQYATQKNNIIQLNNFENYQLWKIQIDQLLELIPFAKAFKIKLESLASEGKIQDQFYLNYTVKDIDFPTLLITSFANYSLKNEEEHFKVGLTLVEFKRFMSSYQNKNTEKWNILLSEFSAKYGFEKISNFPQLMNYFIDEALEGYSDVDNLKDEEFKYVGGPIILLV